MWSLEDSLDELEQLTRSLGAVVVGRVTQRLERLTSHYVGKGKLEEGCLRLALGARLYLERWQSSNPEA